MGYFLLSTTLASAVGPFIGLYAYQNYGFFLLLLVSLSMKQLKKDGIATTATAIYTPLQGFLAGKCGAAYAAPYINRIDNMGYDGIGVARTIHDIFRQNGLATKLLAASFKNSQQVLELCSCGVGAATVAPAVIAGLVKNAAIDSAIQAFAEDFKRLTGKSAMSEL